MTLTHKKLESGSMHVSIQRFHIVVVVVFSSACKLLVAPIVQGQSVQMLNISRFWLQTLAKVWFWGSRNRKHGVHGPSVRPRPT